MIDPTIKPRSDVEKSNVQKQAILLLKKARMAIVRSPTFQIMSGMLLLTNPVVDWSDPNDPNQDPVETIWTDCKTMVFNPDFLVQAHKVGSLKLVTTLVLHELTHLAFRHPWVYANFMNRHPAVYDRAVDMFVSCYLDQSDPKKEWINLHPDYFVPALPWAKGLSVPSIARKLEEDEGIQPPLPLSALNAKQIKALEDMAKAIQKELQAAKTARAIRALTGGSSKTRGDEAGGDDLLFDKHQARLPWQQLLREIIQDEVTRGQDELSWNRINPRMLSQGYYMPSPVGITAKPLVIQADTSSSILGALSRFVAEIETLCIQIRPAYVIILWVDSKVNKVDILTPEQYPSLSTLIHPQGGGGTNLTKGFDWLGDQKKLGLYTDAEMIISFTDGETPYPNDIQLTRAKAQDVWISTELEPSPTGRFIYMDLHLEDEFKALGD